MCKVSEESSEYIIRPEYDLSSVRFVSGWSSWMRPMSIRRSLGSLKVGCGQR